MAEIFIDSSAFFVLGDRASENGREIEIALLKNRGPFLTTNFILAETVSLITKRIGKGKGIEVGEKILQSGLVGLTFLDEETQKEAWKLYKKYKDKDFDFIDATSFVFCQKRGIKEALTLDRHFAQMGFKISP